LSDAALNAEEPLQIVMSLPGSTGIGTQTDPTFGAIVSDRGRLKKTLPLSTHSVAVLRAALL